MNLSQNITEALSSVTEAMVFNGVAGKAPSSSDTKKGEVYVVYNTETNSIIVSDDGKASASRLTRESAKAIEATSDKFKIASASWAFDKGIK